MNYIRYRRIIAKILNIIFAYVIDIFIKNCLANDNYTEIYKCNNNFSFVNPVKFNYNNEKIFPIDIFTFYRQEYIPFIINEEFIKYKNKKIKYKTC